MVDVIAEDVAMANRQIGYLAEGGISAGGPGAATLRDLGDDNTSKLIEDSRALRATLHALALTDPKPPPVSKRQLLTGVPDDPKLTAQQDVAMAVGTAVLEGLKQSKQVQADRGEGWDRAVRDNAPPPTLEDIKAAATGGAEAIETAVGTAYLDSIRPLAVSEDRPTAPVPRGVARSVGNMVLGSLEGQKQNRAAVEAAVGTAFLDSLHPPGRGPASSDGAPPVPQEVSRSVGGMVLGTLEGQRLQRQAAERAVGDLVLESLGRDRTTNSGFTPLTVVPPEMATAVGSAYLSTLHHDRIASNALGGALLDSLEQEAQRMVGGVGTLVVPAGQPQPPPLQSERQIHEAIGAAVLQSMGNPAAAAGGASLLPPNPELAGAVGAATLDNLRQMKRLQQRGMASAVGTAALDTLKYQRAIRDQVRQIFLSSEHKVTTVLK